MTQKSSLLLVEQFEINAREATARVERVAASPGAVCAAVERALEGARKIVIGAGEFVDSKVVEALYALQGVIPRPADEQLAKADAGITGALAGVASSGSVCVAMGPAYTTAASLLMPLHIVLLRADRIVARPGDLFDEACLGGEGLRRNLVFITGPSATADMGQLVRGVHGPHRLHIILLE
jgi:L-lactate dehydrogenase complex protein LldG